MLVRQANPEVHDESEPMARYRGVPQALIKQSSQASRAPSCLYGEVLDLDVLEKLLPAWEDLCTRAAEDNVYYSPRYAQALLQTVEAHQNVRFAVVWDGARLVAMLPVTAPQVAIPVLQSAGRAWQSKYTFSCTPLLDAGLKVDAAEALVNVLASIADAEWIVPALNKSGAACESLVAALSRRGVPWTFSGGFQRATLEAGTAFEDHMRLRVGSSRRKGLARTRRRLEEIGEVKHECHTCGEGLDRALSFFLRIEASGWKGRRGTALVCRQETREFARRAFTGDRSNSICRADVLTVGGNPIAVSLIALAGRTGFAVKACYDEAYRKYSPGLLLEAEIVRDFLSSNWASRLDSATLGTHVLDDLWPDRTEVADLTFSLSPRYAKQRLAIARTSNRTTEAMRRSLKRLIGRGVH